MRPKLSIIIVSWNVRGLLRRALTSIYKTYEYNAYEESHATPEIIVVDKASRDGTVAMLRENFPAVRVIANAENRGFTGGNNQGIAAAQGDHLLLLNPDTEVVDGALQRMVDYLAAHPDVGMVGPQLRYPDGSVQSSRRRFPTLPVLFLESTWLESFAPRRWLRRYYMQDHDDDATQDVDWLMGAAMLTRREVVAEVGGMDEGFFMYSEELDWCRRIKAAGWRIVYLPAARIIHHEGKSSEQVVPARHIYFQSSKVHYTRKYHGPLLAEILRLWLMAHYVWQTGVEGAKWLLGHRRDLRAARIEAYARVLRSRLRQQGPLVD